CLVARNMIALNKGVHFMHITLDGWDQHANIYANLRNLGPTLDTGLGTLIKDLSEMKLLDKTLIVVMGEFGRTPPNLYPGGTGLSRATGRDHYAPVQSALFAGGGVKAGKMIGRTDQYGAAILDPEWRYANRPGPAGPNIRIHDIGTTIYSAL